MEELTDTVTEEVIDETTRKLQEEPKGKFYTDEELNELIAKKVGRKVKRETEKIEKKYASFRETENVLNAALETNNIDDANVKLREYYENEGVKIPQKLSTFTDTEMKRLGKLDADDIIEDGYDSMLQTANELASREYKNLNEREKVTFTTLASKLTEMDNEKALLKLGASKELANDKDFLDFKSKFNKSVTIDEIYSRYTKENKKEVNPIGSMRNNDNTKVKKNFYTREEVAKLTQSDFENDPDLFRIVRESQTSGKW